MKKTINDVKNYLTNLEDNGFDVHEWSVGVSQDFAGEVVTLKLGPTKEEVVADG